MLVIPSLGGIKSGKCDLKPAHTSRIQVGLEPVTFFVTQPLNLVPIQSAQSWSCMSNRGLVAWMCGFIRKQRRSVRWFASEGGAFITANENNSLLKKHPVPPLLMNLSWPSILLFQHSSSPSLTAHLRSRFTKITSSVNYNSLSNVPHLQRLYLFGKRVDGASQLLLLFLLFMRDVLVRSAKTENIWLNEDAAPRMHCWWAVQFGRLTWSRSLMKL